jgi:Trk K+ transport system NAD-binding subunit
VVLSETDVAAPDLVQAALSGNTGQQVTVGGHVLEVAEVEPDDPALAVALCRQGDPSELLPPPERLGRRVLALVDPSLVVAGARGTLPASAAQQHRAHQRPARPARLRTSRRARARAALRLVPRRAWVLLAVIALTAVGSVAVFALSDHLGAVDAVYFTAATMATVGYGDVNLAAAPGWLKVYDVALILVSTVLLASALAFITDALVSSRIDRALGRFPRPRRDHVVVCGLGKAGARVLALLHELGVPCIGVEQDTEAVGIAVARTLRIPVVFADARTRGVLDELGLDQARALMAVTSDDLVNVQSGLRARQHHPDLRLILRVFDARLAARLDHTVELGLTRSVSALAAPAFAAALMGRPLVRPAPLPGVPLRVLETEVPEDSGLAGRSIREVQADGPIRVLALDGRWLPRDDLTIEPGAAIAVVATREQADDLLAPAG